MKDIFLVYEEFFKLISKETNYPDVKVGRLSEQTPHQRRERTAHTHLRTPRAPEIDGNVPIRTTRTRHSERFP